ncbi:Uncharacterized protein Adt_42317 [Abeliophyllum distichum]|uniref:Uncharacterized protein n=1 Tax=Abeliophyllum distichum TaxID=126358 RepID=A0ABD1PV85_9LAMI
MTGFSLAPLNPTTVVHPLFEQFWPSVKRRLFVTNVNHAFHLLEGSGPSRTFISSISVPISVVPISIRAPHFLRPGVIRGASHRKRPALGPLERPDDNDDNDDDAPLLIRRKRGSTSPLKDSTPPIPSSPPPSIPSNEEILPEEELEGPETSIAQPVEESSPFQGVVPPIVQEPIRPNKDKSSQAVESPSDILPHSSSKVTIQLANVDADAILRSIQDLFTSWKQVNASHAARSSSASHPYVASALFSIENMNILKKVVLEYTSFMDMDIVNSSATSQRDKFEHLSNKMAQALELPSLKLPNDLKLSLKIIHQEVSALLAKNVELEAKKTQYVIAMNEKESLYNEIDKAKSSLNEISSNVMVEDSLMMSLAAQMKEI